MGVFAAWHVVVLALMMVVPVLVVAAIVFIAVRATGSRRARSDERIAQRTAELLRDPDDLRD